MPATDRAAGFAPFDEAELGRDLSWKAILDTLAGLQGNRQAAAFDRLAVALLPSLRRMAADLVLRFDSSLARFVADAESIVTAEFVTLVTECVEQQFRPRSFKAVLWGRAKRAFAAC